MKRLLKLPREIWLDGGGLPSRIATVSEAIALIDERLPAAVRTRPHWTDARRGLLAAESSGKPRDVAAAALLLSQALRKEGWIVE